MFNVEYLRSFKFGEYAIFDLVLSFLGVYLISSPLTKFFRIFKLQIPLISWMLFVLPLSVLIHALVGNYTPMTKYFLDPTGHYLLKFFMLTLFILGIKKITRLKK